MRKKVILKVFRYYVRWDKKFKGKPSLLETLLLVVVAAMITIKFKQQIRDSFFERQPAGHIIYDFVEPQVPLPIHEHLKQYDD